MADVKYMSHMIEVMITPLPLPSTTCERRCTCVQAGIPTVALM